MMQTIDRLDIREMKKKEQRAKEEGATQTDIDHRHSPLNRRQVFDETVQKNLSDNEMKRDEDR